MRGIVKGRIPSVCYKKKKVTKNAYMNNKEE